VQFYLGVLLDQTAPEVNFNMKELSLKEIQAGQSSQNQFSSWTERSTVQGLQALPRTAPMPLKTVAYNMAQMGCC